MTTVTLASPLVDENIASEMLGLRPGVLSVWRCTKRYPLPYIKCGRSIRYRLSDIEKFLEQRTVGAIESE